VVLAEIAVAMERDEVDSVVVDAAEIAEVVVVVDLGLLAARMRRARLGFLAPSSADWLRVEKSEAWTISSCTHCPSRSTKSLTTSWRHLSRTR